jgi:hypothetical protein
LITQPSLLKFLAYAGPTVAQVLVDVLAFVQSEMAILGNDVCPPGDVRTPKVSLQGFSPDTKYNNDVNFIFL